MSRFLAATVVTLTLFAGSAASAQEIALTEEYPLRHHPVEVTLSTASGPAAGAGLRVTYRPNSQTVFTETLAADRQGHLSWTPRDAGIVLLELVPAGDAEGEAPIATKRIAVRFGGAPESGIAVMVVAGLLLFGGAGAALWLLLGSPRNPLPQEVEPPST